uniref:DNA polymerase III chi subunit n=1 Tax=uncultured bacterium P11N2 TaxID=1748282 RepID=A0A0U3JCC5_9BACT|nr:DNA polymerase III chi subunit [uncultured bacterium P11N2]
MTRISFFHGASDRLQAAAKWIAEAQRSDTLAGMPLVSPLVVYAPLKEQADALDRLLWTHVATGFTPHCQTASALVEETPVLIATHLDTAPRDRHLVNLSNEIPPGFDQFAHMTEIISRDDDVRLPGRERFRFYREKGYPLESHDLATGG